MNILYHFYLLLFWKTNLIFNYSLQCHSNIFCCLYLIWIPHQTIIETFEGLVIKFSIYSPDQVNNNQISKFHQRNPPLLNFSCAPSSSPNIMKMHKLLLHIFRSSPLKLWTRRAHLCCNMDWLLFFKTYWSAYSRHFSHWTKFHEMFLL